MSGTEKKGKDGEADAAGKGSDHNVEQSVCCVVCHETHVICICHIQNGLVRYWLNSTSAVNEYVITKDCPVIRDTNEKYIHQSLPFRHCVLEQLILQKQVV